ncbi:MAG: glutaredoxin family protein [Desulfobacterales bacterium]
MSNEADQTQQITLYALQTCGHCKDTKEFLKGRGIPFETIYVDMLAGDERNDAMRDLRRINPSCTFPTVRIGDQTVVGFKKDEIKAALKKMKA